jgi:hypothetical protein
MNARNQRIDVVSSYDVVEGRVETLTSRKALRFTLYETITGRAVSCYPGEGSEEQMRDIWGRRTLIDGWVSRDPLTGFPVAVRKINSINVLPEVPTGYYRNARGASPRLDGEPLAETVIRLMRDA